MRSLKPEKDDLLRLESFHNLLHHLINGFLWKALTLVNRRDFYNGHRNIIIQPLFIRINNTGRHPTFYRPVYSIVNYNFGNLLTTCAAMAGRSILPLLVPQLSLFLLSLPLLSLSSFLF